MFEKYKQYLFRKRVSKQPVRNVRFPVYKNIKSILLLYVSDEEEKNADIKEIVSEILESGRTVACVGYVNKRHAASPHLPQNIMLCRADTSFSGRPEKNIIDEIRSEKYDLLIDLTSRYCLPLHYVALYADAAFKTGGHIVDGLHDMMVDMTEYGSSAALYNQIIHFLNTIQSNDK